MLLKENPFYVLDVSLSDNRRKIAEAADEAGFLLGTEKSGEAQSILTNPGKRLSAELGWFPEANAADIASIRYSLSYDQPIITAALTGYSKLNALIYNLSLKGYTDINELGADVVGIDEQYTGIDLSRVTQVINQGREKAGMAAAAENEVQECHRAVIEEIRKLVNEKLKPFDDQTYIGFVTGIADKYIADKKRNAGPVLYDIVDQYEIRMQSEIDSKTKQIIQYVDLIKSEQNVDVIKKSVSKVIERVRAWDVYAQPLQLRSQASGLPHETSRKLATEMRSLCLFLHNEKGLTSEARELASAMQGVFLEVGEFNEVFTNDTVRLDELEKDNENAGFIKEIQSDFEKLDTASKNVFLSGLETVQLREFVDLIASTDEKIQTSKLDTETKTKLRTALCYRARKTAIDVNNDAKNPFVCKYLLCVLADRFSDLAEPSIKLKTDMVALQNDFSANRVNLSNYKTFLSSMYLGPAARKVKFRKDRIKRWLIGIAVLAGLVFLIKSCSTPKPENPYTKASQLNDNVYLDVVSIEPVSGTTKSRTSNKYEAFFCTCITTSGESVSVYIDTYDYRKYFNTSAYSYSYLPKKTEYHPAVRIHGYVTNRERISKYLSGKSNVIKFKSAEIPEQVSPEPTAVVESPYSSSSRADDYVYVDLVSIDPLHAFSSTSEIGSVKMTFFTKFICRCRTSAGKYVWVCFEASDYRKEIDPSISSEPDTTTNTFDAEIIYYSPAARLYGKVTEPEDAIKNVSNQSGIISEIKEDTDTVISFSSIKKPD